MYLHFYGLTRNPFTLMPDPAFYFGSATHRLALSVLEYAIVSGADLTLISGEVGCGKTTLVRCLLDRVRRGDTVGLVSNTHHAFGDILSWILDAFGLEAMGDASARYRTFVAFLREQQSRGRHVVLVVDEAQNLTLQELEAVRVLTNVNCEGKQRLQVILVGQPEVRRNLHKPELRQLVQRISVDYDLRPLTRRETMDYVAHRLAIAGAARPIFSRDAVDVVYRHSGGIPRVVNSLCDFSLTFGAVDRLCTIDASVVQEVVDEKRRQGLFWMEPEHYQLERQ